MEQNNINSSNLQRPGAAPTLSIVIIGRNEGQRLARCLDSIHELRDVTVAEVIYVDSDSNDGSPELADGYGAKVLVVHPERPTAAIGRNAGWKAVQSDFVLFLDGDTILHPDFPSAAFEAIGRDDSIAAVWGHRREIHPEASLFNRVLDLDWIYAPGFTDFCGGDVLMRRKALQEAGGYDETLIAGEEPELCRRMRGRGYKILHIDHPMTGHDLQMTKWKQYWKRATRAGHAYAQISERFRNSNDPAWQKERNANLIRGTFWALSPLGALFFCLRLGSYPLVGWAMLLFLLSARSAWKSRWKSKNLLTLLLYGFHSHLQQIPICIGQLQYAKDKSQGKTRKLIEYKDIR